jgi:uncharacterized protein
VTQEKIEIDLARSRLVALGHVGDLHVANASEEPLERAREIALHDLHVEDVVLQPRIRFAGGVQHIDGLRAGRQKEAGNAARVERLDDELDADFAEAARGVADVGDEYVEVLAIDRRESGDAIEAWTAHRACVLDAALDAVAKLPLASRQAGDAALARRHVAARQVVQHDLNISGARRAREVRRGERVRKLVFDVAKARGTGGGEALQEGKLGEERREIGGELRHNGQNNLNAVDVAAAPWWIWPLALFAVSFAIGIIAVLAGVGGGVLFVPIVGGLFPFHLDFVRGAGLMFALAGTLAAGPPLLRAGMASLRLVMPLALVGSIGSFAGALVGLSLRAELLQTLLGVLILGIAVLIWRTRAADRADVQADALALFLRLEGQFVDPAAGVNIDWRTHRTLLGMAAFGAIGFIGGLFGLGAGFANVPALNLLMAAPLKVAVGSSGLLISVVNSSAAWVYLERGALLPLIVVPAILGVMLGSGLGARLLATTPASVVRRLVIVVMLLAGLRALSRGLGVWA